jgi:hypothetical protein
MAHDGEAVIGSSAGTPFSSSFGNTIRESLKGDQAQKKASGGCRNGMEVSIHHALLVKMRLTEYQTREARNVQQYKVLCIRYKKHMVPGRMILLPANQVDFHPMPYCRGTEHNDSIFLVEMLCLGTNPLSSPLISNCFLSSFFPSMLIFYTYNCFSFFKTRLST